LNNGASIDLDNGHDGKTPLFLAAKGGNIQIVNHLLENGASPNKTDRESNTALHQAVRQENPQVVKALITHGADTTIANDNRLTALTMAKKQGNKTIEVLLSSAMSRLR
jgi:ankyrin repeat protein